MTNRLRATERSGADWILPGISDRWWPWVRGALVTLLAATILLEFVGLRANYERGKVRPFAHVGLSGWRTVDGIVTLRAPHTDEAVAAGLKDGQTLIAVDGQPVGNRVADMAVADRLVAGPEGSTVVLRTRSPDGTIADHRLTRSKRNADALYAGSGLSSDAGIAVMMLSQAVPDFFLLFVAAILMRSRRRETVGLLFATGFIGLVLTGPATFSLFSSRLQLIVAQAVMAVSFIALSLALLSFPDGRISGRFRKTVALLAGLAALVAPFSGQFGGEEAAFVLLVIGIALPTFGLVLRSRRQKIGASRQQIRVALFGFVVGVVLLLASVALGLLAPPVSTDNTALVTWLWVGSLVLSSLAIVALAGGLLLSLIRYRLYDIDSVISRSAAYGLMTVGFIAAFAGLENVLEQAAQAYFSENAGKAAGAMSAALAAGLIGPMHNRIHGWTEQRFRKGLATMRRDLPNTIDDLRETTTFDELAAAVEPRIARGVSADWVRLRPAHLLGAGDIDMRGELERELATPDGRVLALLEVGPRPDGSAHGKDEREAIDAIVEPLARALAVIERREAKEKALDKRIGAIEAALANLVRPPRKKPA